MQTKSSSRDRACIKKSVQGGCDLRVSVLFCVSVVWSPRRREKEKKKF